MLYHSTIFKYKNKTFFNFIRLTLDASLRMLTKRIAATWSINMCRDCKNAIIQNIFQIDITLSIRIRLTNGKVLLKDKNEHFKEKTIKITKL